MSSNIRDYEVFIQWIGNIATRSVILGLMLIAYASRRGFLLEYLANDYYRLGVIEGIGSTFLIYGQINKSSRSILRIITALKNIVNQYNENDNEES